jgi:hypothetical protein
MTMLSYRVFNIDLKQSTIIFPFYAALLSNALKRDTGSIPSRSIEISPISEGVLISQLLYGDIKLIFR